MIRLQGWASPLTSMKTICRSKIAVDLCNTLADVVAELEKLLGPNPDPSHYQMPGATAEFFERHPEIFSGALPFPGAVETLHRIASQGEIIYLSARPKWAREIFEEWLARWGFPSGKLVLTDRKAEVARGMGIVLAIDDAPHEIERYRAAGIPVLVKAQPYNLGYPGRFEWSGKGEKNARGSIQCRARNLIGAKVLRR